jgi:hypothetical protein
MSIRIAGLRAEIWTRDFLNTKQECWPLNHDVAYFVGWLEGFVDPVALFIHVC